MFLPSIFLLALLACTVEFHLMIQHMEAHLLLDIAFQIIQKVVFELRDLATGGANQMMMMMF